jgi:redox-sensitive bicupin YhaK (pirin superfamily)
MTQPRYQELPSSQIPESKRDDGITIRVIAGSVDGLEGPVTEIAADPTYLDVSIPADGFFTHPTQRGHAVIAYVFEGKGEFGIVDESDGETVSHPRLVVFDDGDIIKVRSGGHPLRFVLISGKPLNEPIVRYGPFVMNTRQEIEQALRDLRDGTFIRHQV